MDSGQVGVGGLVDSAMEQWSRPSRDQDARSRQKLCAYQAALSEPFDNIEHGKRPSLSSWLGMLRHRIAIAITAYPISHAQAVAFRIFNYLAQLTYQRPSRLRQRTHNVPLAQGPGPLTMLRHGQAPLFAATAHLSCHRLVPLLATVPSLSLSLDR